ncbi:MAG: NAD-dependent dehydratase [Sporichthyaceae bacterium]
MTEPSPPVRSRRSSAASGEVAAGSEAAPAEAAAARWRTARTRAGHGKQRGLRVAVAAADRGLGPALVERLACHPEIAEVRAIPLTDPRRVQRMRGVDVAVHAPPTDEAAGGPDAVRVAGEVLRVAAKVPRLVLCSSAMVYGADPSNPLPLDEDAPLCTAGDFGVVADLLAIERLASAARPGGADDGLTVLRPAMLVGGGVDSVLTRHFAAPRLLHLDGARPAWQFCHVEDLLSAIEYAVLGRVAGIVTVGCEGWLDQETVEVATGMRRVSVSAGRAFGTAERLQRFGVINAPASELRYVAYPWVIPSTRLTEAGWTPSFDNLGALRALLADVGEASGRRGLRENSLSAAGAAVAMVGTAALLREVRRRRLG